MKKIRPVSFITMLNFGLSVVTTGVFLYIHFPSRNTKLLFDYEKTQLKNRVMETLITTNHY